MSEFENWMVWYGIWDLNSHLFRYNKGFPTAEGGMDDHILQKNNTFDRAQHIGGTFMEKIIPNDF